MGIILFSLFMGVVLLEEVECIPSDEWRTDGIRNVWRLRRTRNRMAFVFAFVVGFLFLFFELYLVAMGRSTFNAFQAIAMAVLLFGCYIYASGKKGPR